MSTIADTSTRYDAVPRQGGGAIRRLLSAFLITIVAGLAFAAAFVVGYARVHDGRIMPGVSVAGVAIGGLDRASAEARLRETLPRLDAGTLSVSIGDSTHRIGYAELRRDYDLAPVLDEAYTVGRSGTFADQVRDQLSSLQYGSSFDVGMRYDQAALDSVVAAAARSVEKPAVDATVRREGGRFTTTPSATGLEVDEAAVVSAATAAIAATETGTSDVAISIAPAVVRPAVDEAAVQPLVAQANAIATTDVTLAVGTEKLTIDGKTLGSWVDIDGPTAGSYRLTIDTSDLSALVTPFAKELTQPAKNATFEFEGSKVVPVPGTNGKALDVDAATAALDTAIRGIQPGGQPITVEHALTSLEPDYTTAQAIADASKIKRVSAWDTRFPVGPKNFWGKNISTPTTKINGYVVAPGKTFDFWKVVGEVSRRTGYGQGAAIINGRTEPTGALAGGICSCSTTLFNAALRYGLDMGARRNHYYYIDRYPLGLDATVFKSSGGAVTTMSFTNDTPHPILIRGINSPGKVRFELWSQPVGRKVTFSKPIVKNVKVATDERHCTPDLRPGQTARVEYPTNGMQVWVTRTVTEDGKVIHQDTYRSNYGRVNGMILFGKPAGYTGRCTEHLR